MLFWLLYLVVHRLLGTREPANDKRDVEILVLRHQLSVLRRQVKRPQLTRLDRVLLAAASQRVARSLWSSFIVRPDTLLRWHRELVRRKWTFRKRAMAGRPGLRREITDLILRLARENPRVGIPADPRRAAEAAGPRLGHDDPHRPASARPGSRPAPRRAYLEGVPALPGIGHAGGRLLHGGNGAAQDPLRAVLHRAFHALGVSDRSD